MRLPKTMSARSPAISVWEGAATSIGCIKVWRPAKAPASVKLAGGIVRVGATKVDQTKGSPNADKTLALLVAAVNNAKDARASELERFKSYEKNACRGVMECFKVAGHDGPISGTVSTVIDSQGKAVSSTVKGKAPANARSCIRDLAKSVVLEDFRGSGGMLECKFAGRLFSGSAMVSLDGRYVPKE